jgi:putative drug exporter of the RND superfamily
MALGMALAVLIDATIVRMILVPAVMELCGRFNWWMPTRRRPGTPAVSRPRAGEEAGV